MWITDGHAHIIRKMQRSHRCPYFVFVLFVYMMLQRPTLQFLLHAWCPAVVVLCLFNTGCTYHALTPTDGPTLPCDTSGTPTWSGTIVPIMQQHCALSGCHVPGGQGTGDYTTWAGLHAKVVDGTLIPSIEWAPNAIAMPPDAPKLSDCDIAIITRWVNAGAPNN